MTRPPFVALPAPAPAAAPLFLPLNRRVETVLHTLRSGARPWILAASGGIDSSAAMLLMARAGVPCLVVHIQHHLRVDAHRDQHVVQTQARLLGLPCHVVHLPRTTIDDRENTAARARRLRYDALTQIAAQLQADVITAHHSEDLLETFLQRVQRGSGLAQVFGLQPTMQWNGVDVHRPLLSLWKHELRSLLAAASFPWIEDSSNASDAYARNQLRQQLAPLVQYLGTSDRFSETLAALAHEAGQLAAQQHALPSLETLFSAPPAHQPPTPDAVSYWLDRTHTLAAFDEGASAFQDALYRWCRQQNLPTRRDVLQRVAHAVWNGDSLTRDARGLRFHSTPAGLKITRTAAQSSEETPCQPTRSSVPAYAHSDDEPTRAPALVRLLPNEAVQVGDHRLELVASPASLAVFARPLADGDRFLSPHSEREVGVRKRLTRDGVARIQRDRAVVVLIGPNFSAKTLAKDEVAVESESPSEAVAFTRAEAKGTAPEFGYATSSDRPHVSDFTRACTWTGTTRIVGVVHGPNQRLDILTEDGEALIILSHGAKPSDD